MVNAYIVDEVIKSDSSSPSGGTSYIDKDVNVHVSDAPDRETAVREAQWRTWRDADGEIEGGPTLVGVQGPDDGLDPNTWLVTHNIRTIRSW